MKVNPTKAEGPRLFIAVPVQLNLPTLTQIVKKLKISTSKSEMQIRWAPPENYHITLSFLGNTSTENLPVILNVLNEICGQYRPFELQIRQIGAFEDLRRARVIWAGVQNSRTLRDLQSALAERLKRELGLVVEPGYTPHLTLARLRNPQSVETHLSPFLRRKMGEVKVQGLALYESHLAVPYSRYEILNQFPLTGELPLDHEDVP